MFSTLLQLHNGDSDMFLRTGHYLMSYSLFVNKHKWFNDDCKDARLEFYRCLNLFRNDKSEINCKT